MHLVKGFFRSVHNAQESNGANRFCVFKLPTWFLTRKIRLDESVTCMYIYIYIEKVTLYFLGQQRFVDFRSFSTKFP